MQWRTHFFTCWQRKRQEKFVLSTQSAALGEKELEDQQTLVAADWQEDAEDFRIGVALNLIALKAHEVFLNDTPNFDFLVWC